MNTEADRSRRMLVRSGWKRLAISFLLISTMFLIMLSNAVDLDSDIRLTSRGQRIVGEQHLSIPGLAASHGDRYGVYIAVREHANQAMLTIHPNTRGLDPLYLYGIANVESIQTEDFEVPDRGSLPPVTAEGQFRSLGWEVRATGSRMGSIRAWMDDDLLILHAEETPEAPSLGTVNALPREADDRSILRDGLADGLVAFMLAALGAFALGGFGGSTIQRASMGFFVGVSTLAVTGLVRLPGFAGLGIAAALLVLVGAFRGLSEVEIHPRKLCQWMFVAMAFIAASTFSRALGLVTTSPDSFRYLAGGSALSSGNYGLTVLDAKHMIGQQALHAPLVHLGVEGFQSLGPLALVAGLAVTFFLIRRILEPTKLPAKNEIALATMLALGTSAAVWRLAAYINAHVLFGATLACFSYMWAEKQSEDGLHLRAAVPGGLLLSGLVLLRPEGLLLVGVMFVACAGAAVVTTRPWWTRSFLIAAIVGGIWNLSLMVANGIQFAPLVFLVASVGLGVASIIYTVVPRIVWASFPFLVSGLLWGIVVALFVHSSEAITFFSSIEANIFKGIGGWGVLGGSLAIFLVFVLVWTAFGGYKNGGETISLPVVLFLPIVLLVKLGDGIHGAEVSLAAVIDMLSGGGRVGWGDSVNRMWMHIAFLLPVAYLGGIALAVRGRARGGLIGTLTLLALTTLGVVYIASLWAPSYLPSRWVEWAPLLAAVGSIATVVLATGGQYGADGLSSRAPVEAAAIVEE